jgi:transposase-like protein
VNPDIIAEKLAIVADAGSRGRTAAEAAALVGWSRATLYRHQTGSSSKTSTA